MLKRRQSHNQRRRFLSYYPPQQRWEGEFRFDVFEDRFGGSRNGFVIGETEGEKRERHLGREETERKRLVEEREAEEVSRRGFGVAAESYLRRWGGFPVAGKVIVRRYFCDALLLDRLMLIWMAIPHYMILISGKGIAGEVMREKERERVGKIGRRRGNGEDVMESRFFIFIFIF